MTLPFLFQTLRRGSLSCACALLAFAPPTRAQMRDLPEIRVPWTNEPLTMDGKLDEPCWKNAARVILTDPWKQTGHRLEPTEVYMLRTDEALYFAFLAQDDQILVHHFERDERTHRDDCVEFFLARPRETVGDALAMEINAYGVVADFFYRHPSWINYSWDPDTVIIAANFGDKLRPANAQPAPGYCVEIKIPWAELLYALPEKEIPKRLRANFARWNYGSKGRIFSIWSDPLLPTPGPNRPERYGWLILQ